MNKNNAKDYLPLVQALADGKTLQFLAQLRQRRAVIQPQQEDYPLAYGWNSDMWVDVGGWGDVSFGFPADRYRVKPEPVVMEKWAVLYSDGYTTVPVKTLEDARRQGTWSGGSRRATPTHFIHYIITDGVPKAEFLPIKR
jgi:hypothetical protein